MSLYEQLRQCAQDFSTWPDVCSLKDLVLLRKTEEEAGVDQSSVLLAGQYNVNYREGCFVYKSNTTTVYRVESPENINASSVVCKSICLPIDSSSVDEDQDLQVKKRTKSQLNRFCNEITILKTLSELTNNVLIYDVSIFKKQTNDAVYVNMVQKDAGLNLHQLLKHKKLKKFDTQFIILVMEQLFKALKFLHEHHCCHRDVKPENICYSLYNETTTLIDFDLAIIGGNKSGTDIQNLQGAVGTAGFIPPEMFTNKYYDGMAGDIWSSAITLLELLTHKDLFEKYVLRTYAPNNMSDIDVFKSNVYKMLRNIKMCISEEIYLTQDVQMLIRNMLKLNPKVRPNAVDLCHEFQQKIKRLFQDDNVQSAE